MTTETAQRRLLEALAAQNRTPGGIAGLRLGMPYAISVAIAADEPALAAVWQALDDLAASVQADLYSKEHSK